MDVRMERHLFMVSHSAFCRISDDELDKAVSKGRDCPIKRMFRFNEANESVVDAQVESQMYLSSG
jgi:hypothetical protein